MSDIEGKAAMVAASEFQLRIENGARGTRDMEHARLGNRAGRRQRSYVAGVRTWAVRAINVK
jgi:hypothetical protein